MDEQFDNNYFLDVGVRVVKELEKAQKELNQISSSLSSGNKSVQRLVYQDLAVRLKAIATRM